MGDGGLRTQAVETRTQPYVGSGTEIAGDSEFLHRLRMLSRYPQGVDDQLLARLEATYGEMERYSGGRGLALRLQP